MNAAPHVMLLIDADNVSVGVMEQAVERLLAEYGALHVRRAYCNAESALKHQQLFKRLAIRPIVNLAAGKNSTDIAMAVDAIDLVVAERPDVVVIASSDSDFAPLVSRLREKGCRVRGIGQQGKTGDETQRVYDAYDVLPPKAAGAEETRVTRTRTARGTTARKATAKTVASELPFELPPDRDAAADEAPQRASTGTTAAGHKTAGRKTAGHKTAGHRSAAGRATKSTGKAAAKSAAASPPGAEPRAVEEAPAVPAVEVAEATAAAEATTAPPTKVAARKRSTAAKKASPVRKTASRKSAAQSTPASPEAAPALATEPPVPAAQPEPPPEAVQAVLRALPALARGESLELQKAAEALRKSGLLSRSSSARKLFGRHPEWFELTPPHDPRQVAARRSDRG